MGESNEETKPGLPFNHNYAMRVSIGLSGADRTDVVNPSRDSSYSKEEWDALPRAEQEKYLQESLNDWALGFYEATVTFSNNDPIAEYS